MLFNQPQHHISKRFGAWVLMLFVVSWVNLSIQSPAHAAMKQGMQAQSMSVEMHDMAGMDMQQCHCPPALCDAVLSTDDQATDGYLSSLSLNNLLLFSPLMVSTINDEHQSQGVIRLRHLNQQYRQTSPLPISLTSTLLI